MCQAEACLLQCMLSTVRSWCPCSRHAPQVLRMHYCSLRTPDQTVDFNMATSKRWVEAAAAVL